jgi:hypothetical protein
MNQSSTPAIETLATITVMFALVFALSLLVERTLEVAKSLYDVIDGKRNLATFWTARAAKIADRLERRVRLFEYVSPKAVQPVLNRVYDLLLNTQGGYSGTALVLSGDLVRAAGVRLGTKLLGIALGIALALWLDIDFIKLWHPQVQIGSHEVGVILKGTVAQVASGVAIGLGASPVHKLITTLEKKQGERHEKEGEDK